MRIHSYKDIKNEYRNLRKFEEICSKHCTPEHVKEYIDEYRKDIVAECRKFYKKQAKYSVDRFSVPLLNSKQIWRTVADSDGMSGTDFIIIPNNGETDEDIEEFVRDTVFCGYGDLLIDCTGKKCSWGWNARKVPCGIAITHDWVYDY